MFSISSLPFYNIYAFFLEYTSSIQCYYIDSGANFWFYIQFNNIPNLAVDISFIASAYCLYCIFSETLVHDFTELNSFIHLMPKEAKLMCLKYFLTGVIATSHSIASLNINWCGLVTKYLHFLSFQLDFLPPSFSWMNTVRVHKMFYKIFSADRFIDYVISFSFRYTTHLWFSGFWENLSLKVYLTSAFSF